MCLAFMAGIGALALVMNALYQVHKHLIQLFDLSTERHLEIMEFLDVQPPLADEKPQAVQVTIKPTAKQAEAWNKWMDFEASQKAALDEFKEQ